MTLDEQRFLVRCLVKTARPDLEAELLALDSPEVGVVRWGPTQVRLAWVTLSEEGDRLSVTSARPPRVVHALPLDAPDLVDRLRRLLDEQAVSAVRRPR